jgi:hypothetical protein
LSEKQIQYLRDDIAQETGSSRVGRRRDHTDDRLTNLHGIRCWTGA